MKSEKRYGYRLFTKKENLHIYREAANGIGKNIGDKITSIPGSIRDYANENFGTKEREQMQKFKGNPDLKSFYGDKTHQNVAASIATELGLDFVPISKSTKANISSFLNSVFFFSELYSEPLFSILKYGV